jgi:chemotaxis-related protein WspB
VLFLLFNLGADRYAIAASEVAQVLPLVSVKPIPQAPVGLAGLFDLHGTLVPAIDLRLAMVGEPAAQSLSTRLIVISSLDGAGARRAIGLIAEKVTRTVDWDPATFVDCGIRTGCASYAGPMARDSDRLVQRLDPAELLPATIRDALSRRPVEQSCPTTPSLRC